MQPTMESTPSVMMQFDILEVLQGPPARPVHYRISVGSYVKYLAAPKPNPIPYLPDVNGDRLGFNTVPAGDWDIASLIPSSDGKLVINNVEKARFPNITPAWHSASIDLLELSRPKEQSKDYENQGSSRYAGELQLGGHLPAALFPGPASLGQAKVAAYWSLDLEGRHSHGLARESHIYSLIRDASIAPRFLAHLTDNRERIIGYVLESVPARAAEIGDLDRCRDVLQKLHGLGIAHGHLTKDAFLIHQETAVVQILYFYSSYETTDRDVLAREMTLLEEVLQPSLSPRLSYDEMLMDEVTAIQQRDGFVHPVVFAQIRDKGQIEISPQEHQAMLADLGKDDLQRTSQADGSDIVRLEEHGQL